MSTHHQSIYWPSQKSTSDKHHLVIDDGTQCYGVTTYLGRKMINSFMHFIGCMMSGMIIEKVVEIAKENIMRPNESTRALGIFSVNPLTSTNVIFESVKESFTKKNGHHAWRLHLMEKSIGLNQLEGVQCLDKVGEIIKAFMTEQRGAGNMLFLEQDTNRSRFIFNTLQTDREMFEWSQALSLDFFNFLYKNLGFTVVGKAEVTDEMKQHFGIGPETALPNFTKLNCLTYALLMAGEVNAKEYIFNRKNPDPILEAPVEALSKWGWRVVDAPK